MYKLTRIRIPLVDAWMGGRHGAGSRYRCGGAVRSAASKWLILEKPWSAGSVMDNTHGDPKPAAMTGQPLLPMLPGDARPIGAAAGV